jgi:hypothetical protein
MCTWSCCRRLSEERLARICEIFLAQGLRQSWTIIARVEFPFYLIEGVAGLGLSGSFESESTQSIGHESVPRGHHFGACSRRSQARNAFRCVLRACDANDRGMCPEEQLPARASVWRRWAPLRCLSRTAAQTWRGGIEARACGDGIVENTQHRARRLPCTGGQPPAQRQLIQGRRQDPASGARRAVGWSAVGPIITAYEIASALAKAYCTVQMREAVGWARELRGDNGIMVDYNFGRFSNDTEALTYMREREVPMPSFRASLIRSTQDHTHIRGAPCEHMPLRRSFDTRNPRCETQLLV